MVPVAANLTVSARYLAEEVDGKNRGGPPVNGVAAGIYGLKLTVGVVLTVVRCAAEVNGGTDQISADRLLSRPST